MPIALSGLSSQTSGAPAVQGIQLGSGSSSVAVYGQGYFGVTGRSNSDGIGVTGRSDSPNGIGVHGQATFPGAAGIVGVGGQGGHAGRFLGDVVIKGDLIVEGSVSKKGGTFRIDHPLDPANKYLSHSFVESPDMMNVYNDNAVLGDDGTVWVQLPAYFEALNRDFRYQLTAIGGPGPNLFIAEEIQGNRFKIAGGSPGLKVSWHVTGIRQDAYANDHPVIVEQDKPASERGSYLYPGRGSR